MHRFLILFGFICHSLTGVAQNDELPFISTQDLSHLLFGDSIDQVIYDTREWETTFRPEPVGYIGDDYRRLRIHVIDVRQDSVDPLVYQVTGKTKVKDNVCDFTGTVTVTQAYLDTDEIYPDEQQGIVIGTFHFVEDARQKGTGVFRGTFWSRYWLPHGKRVPPLAASGPARAMDNPREIAVYNSLDMVSPNFGNNQFTGTWTSYRSGKSKPVAWADFRFSYPTPLDIGASEFSPSPDFHDRGWRSYAHAWIHADTEAERRRALEAELALWWR